MILETLYRGLSFTRVVLCIQDKRRGEMVARFGLGRGLEELKPRFRFPLSAGDDAFSLAVHQHRDFAYPSRTTNTAELPAWFRNLLTPGSCGGPALGGEGGVLRPYLLRPRGRPHPAYRNRYQLPAYLA